MEHTLIVAAGQPPTTAIGVDLNAVQHPRALRLAEVGVAVLGVDAHPAGLGHYADELAEQEARAVLIARHCRAYVVFASFTGLTQVRARTRPPALRELVGRGLPIARAGYGVLGPAG